MALTRHTPDVVIGTANGIGVNGGIGVLALVATAPSPTSNVNLPPTCNLWHFGRAVKVLLLNFFNEI